MVQQPGNDISNQKFDPFSFWCSADTCVLSAMSATLLQVILVFWLVNNSGVLFCCQLAPHSKNCVCDSGFLLAFYVHRFWNTCYRLMKVQHEVLGWDGIVSVFLSTPSPLMSVRRIVSQRAS
jgi:hypothetical protein